jgi:pimeloyl-ACP methyl ester carboxylesterase
MRSPRTGAVVTIDGPGYGRSSPIRRDFTLDECAQTAGVVLDQLGITEPVDWVGNAWGGHVGITLAVSQPHRLRSLVTIAAPLTPVHRRQRWTQTYPLALLYRLTGEPFDHQSAVRCAVRCQSDCGTACSGRGDDERL